MEDNRRPNPRYMKFPYTYSAKLIQFPWKFHIDNSPLFKYWFVGILLCCPLFLKIQKLSYDPANVEKWRKIRQEMYYPSKEH